MRHRKNNSFALPALVLLGLVTSILNAAGPPLLSEEVSGRGQSQADALQAAMDKAGERIVALLKGRQPDLRWQPSAAYLRESRLVRDVVHVPDSPSDLVGPHHVVTLRIEVSEQDVRKMVQQDRLQQRHLLAAKLLAALVALLSVLAGFFRLEDATRGYYTRPLQFGLALCVAAIMAALWLVW